MSERVVTSELVFQGNCGPSTCNYHLFKNNNEKYCVIEQTIDTTTSITNRIENIVLDICSQQDLKHEDIRFYEYYPKHKLPLDYIYELRRVYLDDNNKAVWKSPSEESTTLVSEAMSQI